MEKQPDAGRVIEHVREPGVGVLFEHGGFDPPQVPVILPTVEAIAGDSAAELRDQGIGHPQGQQQVSCQSEQPAPDRKFTQR